MTKFDEIYDNLVKEVLAKGVWSGDEVRTVYADGTPASYKSLSGVNFSLDNSTDEAMLLTSRYIPFKSATREIYWIWLMRSNNVDELEKMKCYFWGEWAKPDDTGVRTIGKAYGYQLAQPIMGYDNQVDYVIGELKNNPHSRRIMTSLWNVAELPEMNLQPCVFLTMWNVLGDRVDLRVIQRSADVALGLPNNVFQYSVLHKLIAHECGLQPGMLHWSIGDTHIYDRHVDILQEQIANKLAVEPKLIIDYKDDIYDFRPDDVKVTDYDFKKMPQYKFEIAI